MTMDAAKQAGSYDLPYKELKDAIAEALAQGVRKANVEIELIHFIKRELAKEEK